MKLRREEAGLGSEEPISIPTMLKDISEAYPEVSERELARRRDHFGRFHFLNPLVPLLFTLEEGDNTEETCVRV